jgi:hypothetical protein
MATMAKIKRKSMPRRIWRFVRSIYYWPGMIGLHAIRLIGHRQDDWYRITAPWIRNRGYPDKVERRPRLPGWYHFRHRFTFDYEYMKLNIGYATEAGDVKGLALMFAMGAGDYFFATPLLAALRNRFPQLPIIGFATTNAGEVNSPLLPELMRHDPNLNEVRLYDGKQTRRYKNYDYSDAVRLAPPNYLTMPVFGNHLPSQRHRVISLFECFGLEMPATVPVPLIHTPSPPPPHVLQLLSSIKQQVSRQGAKGVVFLQADSRASHYSYPEIDELASGLSERGYFVLSASKLGRSLPCAHTLDFKEFALMDSILLLKLLKEQVEDTRIVSVASVFWSVSAGLGIPNLGMQHFPDDAMHNYWYPNITVITHRDYPRLPAPVRFLAGAEDYKLNDNGYAVFNPGFVLSCFDMMRKDMRDNENTGAPLRRTAIQ